VQRKKTWHCTRGRNGVQVIENVLHKRGKAEGSRGSQEKKNYYTPEKRAFEDPKEREKK